MGPLFENHIWLGYVWRLFVLNLWKKKTNAFRLPNSWQCEKNDSLKKILHKLKAHSCRDDIPNAFTDIGLRLCLETKKLGMSFLRIEMSKKPKFPVNV